MRGSAGTLDGIIVSGTRSGLSVRNGSVTGFTGSGIEAPMLESGVFIDLHLNFNGEAGIDSGRNSRIVNCLAKGNLGPGIRAGRGASIEGCAAEQNGDNGIEVWESVSMGTITQCLAVENGRSGIAVLNYCAISDCIAIDNESHGFGCGARVTVMNCSSSQNGASGFSASVQVSSRRGGRGNDNVYTNCVASINAFYGFDLANGRGAVMGCSATFNDLSGIRAGSGSLIIDNSPVFNDGAGIEIAGTDNRIEGNQCTNNGIGIDANAGGNFIVRNAASGNSTNWDIVSGNRLGVIVLAPSSVAVTGNSGGTGVGTTNPWANFTY